MVPAMGKAHEFIDSRIILVIKWKPAAIFKLKFTFKIALTKVYAREMKAVVIALLNRVDHSLDGPYIIAANIRITGTP